MVQPDSCLAKSTGRRGKRWAVATETRLFRNNSVDRTKAVRMGRGLIGRNAALMVVAGLLLHAGGCGSGVGAATEEAARDALESALDSWKSGRKAADMRNESPEVIVG